jgi:hypothetical protein
MLPWQLRVGNAFVVFKGEKHMPPMFLNLILTFPFSSEDTAR